MLLLRDIHSYENNTQFYMYVMSVYTALTGYINDNDILDRMTSN